jgi:hypothetical protein
MNRDNRWCKTVNLKQDISTGMRNVEKVLVLL